MKAALCVLLFLNLGICHAEPLRVGLESQDYLPYYRALPGDPAEGYAIALLQRFAISQGLSLELEALPINRLHRNLQTTDRLMLVFPDNPAWSRQLKGDTRMHYSRPAIRIVDGSLVLREHLGRGAESVRRLGTVRGFTPEAWQERLHNGQVQLVEASDIGSLVRMLLRLRIDAIYANPEVLHHYLDTNTNLGSDRLQLDPELPMARTAFHASSLNHPELLEAFDRFLIEQRDELAQLRRQHGLACGPSDLAEETPACQQPSEAP
ncbi:substrate-binding periplasmic protein [Pseudomonas sp. TCU-HL1]|uniref:substrate-binding periplasmic protein n=1 Tax=Pseudomonas sp. TCU-HL1 TaxID=1856685 RepID=UPI00083E1FEB|nr:transporter substrate-binding domain-containing protein [Pseudomonas sp. TCU-HL1]AOE88258.1 peptidase M24 [Pseudomonas sp. TCU-HL1]